MNEIMPLTHTNDGEIIKQARDLTLRQIIESLRQSVELLATVAPFNVPEEWVIEVSQRANLRAYLYNRVPFLSSWRVTCFIVAKIPARLLPLALECFDPER